MNNFVKRTLTGSLIVAVIVGAIMVNQYTFFGFFFLTTVFGVAEFYNLNKKEGVAANKPLGIVTSCCLFVANCLIAFNHRAGYILLFLVPILVCIIFISELYRKQKRPFENIAYTLLAVIYVALPFSLFIHSGYWLADFNNYNYALPLGFFILMWLNDTGAYLVGSAFGKNRLFERISPKKSWEGSIGGGLTSLLAACGLSFIFPDFGTINWLVFGLIVVIFGSFGDLTESLYKRSINIKDSGTILPGHGGILDRFDGVLLAAPAVFAYLKFLEFI